MSKTKLGMLEPMKPMEGPDTSGGMQDHEAKDAMHILMRAHEIKGNAAMMERVAKHHKVHMKAMGAMGVTDMKSLKEVAKKRRQELAAGDDEGMPSDPKSSGREKY